MMSTAKLRNILDNQVAAWRSYKDLHNHGHYFTDVLGDLVDLKTVANPNYTPHIAIWSTTRWPSDALEKPDTTQRVIDHRLTVNLHTEDFYFNGSLVPAKKRIKQAYLRWLWKQTFNVFKDLDDDEYSLRSVDIIAEPRQLKANWSMSAMKHMADLWTNTWQKSFGAVQS